MSEGNQLDLLEHVRRGTKLWILDNLMGLSVRMRCVLKAIDSRARDQLKVSMSRREIASCTDLSVPTVQRGIKDLEQADYLICDRVSKPGMGKQASTYQIVWSNLQAYANGERCESGEDIESGPTDHGDTTPRITVIHRTIYP